MAASFTSQVAEVRAGLKSVNQRLTATEQRLDIVESEAAELRKVAYRYVIDEVHKKLQVSLGPKEEQQEWQEYLEDRFSSSQGWFKEHQLGFAELVLLCERPETIYDAGNQAAPRPPAELLAGIVGEGSEAWAKLWKVACS
ncbi:hypothetical protein HYH03_005062 [Edaphochlamys debaryana]|uniref:Uncharacterized protein n=1 Tax=Edaphochlamys debaryana TaxID=47281 RepID=A0A836C1S0_9CHLO|nr:hypothetical protein HYH03_005062 [Edaphochlamys debaryana]|eukprot:KAG2497065.1 hypothetical protein HYH03_005062 [Edaphochlamys debaryana]